MKNLKKLLLCCLILPTVISCSSSSKKTISPYSLNGKKPTITDIVAMESERLGEAQQEIRETVEQKAERPNKIAPLMPQYDPLDDHIISLSMIDEDLQFALYSISKEVGINLIIDPAISRNKKLITINFKDAPASLVLREILKTFDLYYVINKELITVKPFEERFFKLSFLDTNLSTSFKVGGDVLGGGNFNSSASGLSGSFTISGRGASKGNAYDVLEDILRKTISKNGRYSLNRISGSLSIKDTPSVVTSVAKMVNHLTEMLSRQILIEARIVEVSLTDNYKYGIDWDLLRVATASGTNSGISSAAWSLGGGMVLGGLAKGNGSEFAINATIDALKTFGNTKVISNPSIRAKHAQPASISVGTSFSYKKSVKTTTTASIAAYATGTTEVEVGTVFDGLILGVIPFIGEDGQISLLINPIKSDVDRDSLALERVGAGSQQITLPKVSVKEISTTISLKSGDVIILGGLIDRKDLKSKKSVPVLSSIPILGYLFKSNSKTEETSELVIILSVSIV